MTSPSSSSRRGRSACARSCCRRGGCSTGCASRTSRATRASRWSGTAPTPEYGGGEPRYFVRGFRQTATAPFGALTARQLHLQGAADSGRGGLCLGDSGSPQFLAGSNLAVSLLSAPGDTCREIVAQRLDTPAERRFLARFVTLR